MIYFDKIRKEFRNEKLLIFYLINFAFIRTKTDLEVAKLSQELKIDIAIDLMGFTKLNRFGIFIEKCAPIQINYLGYPGTTGSNSIDYIIADKFLIPKINQKKVGAFCTEIQIFLDLNPI